VTARLFLSQRDRPVSAPGHREAAVTCTADIHHRMLPGFFWPATNGGDHLVADVAAAVGRRAAAVSADVYEVILREIPQLRDDKPLLSLLASSVDSNVDTCLQIMQHRIDLAAVQAPAAAVEYGRSAAPR
jgi:hypothetical protein